MGRIAADVPEGDEMLERDAVREGELPDPAQDTALVFLVDRGNDHSDVCMRLRHVASPPILCQVSDKNVWDTYPIILYKHKQCNGILCTIHERSETAPIP